MKYIFTIATNVYTSYFENFKNSINNFYPGEDKTLIVFSNKLQEYNNWQIGNTKIEVISIPNLFYTSINLNKFNFIEWYALNNNLDDDQLVFFFDIDTYFYHKTDYNFDNLNRIINYHQTSVIFSNHPFNLYIKQNNIAMYMHGYIYNKDFIDPIEPKIFSDYSFSEHNLWCQDCITSFFCGTIKSIKNLNTIFTNYYKDIIHSDRVIPQICEEDIVNYIWIKQLLYQIQNQYIYVTDEPIININANDIANINKTSVFKGCDIDGSLLIVNQKYNVDIKNLVK